MTSATVGQVMSPNPVSVSPDESLSVLQEKMNTAGVHHLLVSENAQLLGIISDRDVLAARGLTESGQANTYARDIMTQAFVTASDDAAVDTASIILIENNFSALPVIGIDDEVLGILTWRDLLTYYVYHS